MAYKLDKSDQPSYTEYTLDMFARSIGKDHAEIIQFNNWRKDILRANKHSFETPHLSAQRPLVRIRRHDGVEADLISFANYNYLGYSYHPEVLAAAKTALDTYGLGATGSPVLNGTFDLHNRLEKSITDFFGQEGYGVSLFTSGYGTNVGLISSYIHKGDFIVLDRSCHASLVDGALLSQGKIMLFKHNDPEHLERVLKRIQNGNARIMVCMEGIYSSDGDYGNLKDIITVAKKYDAVTLVDEAHSLLVAGKNGRGVVEEQGVLGEADMIVGTFSKSFGGVGGCVYAKTEIIQYVNYYARARMFSCAMDPAVTGGLIKVLELAGGEDGRLKRKRIIDNANYLRSLLHGKVDIGQSRSWVIPIIYGSERLTVPVGDFLQKNGLDISLMMFPAVPKNQSRIRAFVTSEHTREQLERGAEIILKAARKYDFLLP